MVPKRFFAAVIFVSLALLINFPLNCAKVRAETLTLGVDKTFTQFTTWAGTHCRMDDHGVFRCEEYTEPNISHSENSIHLQAVANPTTGSEYRIDDQQVVHASYAWSYAGGYLVLNSPLDISPYSWDQVKDWPVRVTIDISYDWDVSAPDEHYQGNSALAEANIQVKWDCDWETCQDHGDPEWNPSYSKSITYSYIAPLSRLHDWLPYCEWWYGDSSCIGAPPGHYFAFRATADVSATSVYGGSPTSASANLNVRSVSVEFLPYSPPLIITEAATDKPIYSYGEMANISCKVIGPEGNQIFDADVSAEIYKPDGSFVTVNLGPVTDPRSDAPISESNFVHYLGCFRPFIYPAHSAVGNYRVVFHAHKAGYSEATSELGFDFVLSGLRGILWDILFEGNRLVDVSLAEQAAIVVTSLSNPNHRFWTFTNDNGLFEVETLEAGIYDLEVPPRSGVGAAETIGFHRQVEVELGKTTFIELPSHMVDLQKRLYKEKALEAYSKLKNKWVAVTTQWRIANIVGSGIITGLGLYEAYNVNLTCLADPYLCAGNQAQWAEFVLIAKILSINFGLNIAGEVPEAVKLLGKGLIEQYELKTEIAINNLLAIVDDPPDLAFQTVYQPVYQAPLVIPSEYDGIVTPAAVRLANALGNQNALEAALLITFERYQGAIQEHKPEYILLQLGAIQNYARLLGANAQELKQASALFKSEIEAVKSEMGPTFDSWQTNLELVGLSNEDIAELQNLGFNAADIGAYRQLLLGFKFDDLILALNELGSVADNRAASSTDFISETSKLLSELLPVRVSGGAQNSPQTPNYKASFSLDITSCSPSAGWLKYTYAKVRMSFVSTAIQGLSVAGTTATITGTGTLNGAVGYTFTAIVYDGSPDKFAITIKKPDGTVYYQTGLIAVSMGDLSIVSQ